MQNWVMSYGNNYSFFFFHFFLTHLTERSYKNVALSKNIRDLYRGITEFKKGFDFTSHLGSATLRNTRFLAMENYSYI
jgi:hypothetical protein